MARTTQTLPDRRRSIMRLRRLIEAGILSFAVVLAVPTASSAQTVLKFHHDLPEDTAQHVAAERFAELVAERTDGAVEGKIVPNNQPADDGEALQPVRVAATEGRS